MQMKKDLGNLAHQKKRERKSILSNKEETKNMDLSEDEDIKELEKMLDNDDTSNMDGELKDSVGYDLPERTSENISLNKTSSRVFSAILKRNFEEQESVNSYEQKLKGYTCDQFLQDLKLLLPLEEIGK